MGVWIETQGFHYPVCACGVTPCMGVWIETTLYFAVQHYPSSHPVWVCGLKHTEISLPSSKVTVTPCMGVWIETLPNLGDFKVRSVTPCMGVWIETDMRLSQSMLDGSHPVWVCGLKQRVL